MSADIEELNKILFEQLNALSNISVKDEDFENTRLKAEQICQVADRVIRNSELALRNEVWNSTRRFNLSTRKTNLAIGTYNNNYEG